MPNARDAIAVVHPAIANESTDWMQFAYDAARDGYNANETVLSTGTVASLRLKWSAKVDSGVFAQPLFVRSVNIGTTQHDVLFVTGFFNAFAIDPYGSDGGTSLATIKTFWKHVLPSSQINCAGTPYHNGTWDTPYIDKAAARMYLVDGARNLDAIDIRTGNSIYSAQVDPYSNAGVDSAVSYNPALRKLYISEALRCGYEDLRSPMHGRVITYSVAGGRGVQFTPVTAPGYYGGGVWGMGGVSIDTATNDVYAATGNSWPSSSVYGEHVNYAENLVALTSNLSAIASSYPGLPQLDDDFGDSPVLFSPVGCAPMIAASNKDGELLFYKRSGIASGPIKRFPIANPFPGDMIDGPAFDPLTQMLYEPSSTDSPISPAYKHGLSAFSFPGCKPTFVWNIEEGTVAPTGPNPAADAYSSAVAANGVVYFSAGSTKRVYANSAMTGRLLWTSPVLGAPVRVPPIIVNGRLYVADGAGDVYAFGL